MSVQVGQRVTFHNNDTIAHLIAGGPDPGHPDCLEIDSVNFLAPGERRDTRPFPAARTCDFHDHSVLSPIYTGRIVIR